MKLVHNSFTFDIEFEENIVNLIVVENKSYLRQLVKELYDAERGSATRYVLSEGLTELSVKDNMILLRDVFDVEVNDKKTLNKLYKRIEEVSNGYYCDNWNDVRSELCAYLYKLTDTEMLPLEFDVDIKLGDILKTVGMKLNFNDKTVLDSVMTYIDVCAEFSIAKIVVGVCWSAVFSIEEIEFIKRHCFDKKIHLLLFDDEKINIDKVKIYIIDHDLCEIF